MKLYDITIPMDNTLACWPGDAPYKFSWTCKKDEESVVNVGQVSMSVHTGTHTDAPFHFDNDSPRIESLSLDPYIGPARVIDVRGKSIISTGDLPQFELSKTPRVLLRTDGWTNHRVFPETIPVMDESLPTFLQEQGVILVGLDVPSVDAIDSTELPNHHALGKAGITILESLYLQEVPEGVYELIALPLRLVGADGSPVRAVLRAVKELS